MATPAETKAAGEVIVFKLVGATADKLKNRSKRIQADHHLHG